MREAPPPFAFEPLFERLRQEGFALGVDHQMRVQQLLERLPPDLTAEDWKTLLCPLFATNRAQQEKFYQIFGEVFRVVPKSTSSGTVATLVLPDAVKESWQRRVLRARWAYLALVPLAAVLLWWWLKPKPVDPKPKFELEQTGQQKETPKPVPVEVEAPVTPHSHQLEFPTPKDLPLPGDEAQARARKWAVVALPFLAFCVYWLYRKVQKVMADRGRAAGPPYFFPIHCSSLGEALFRTQRVRDLARVMRRRRPVDDQVLDVGGTIRATVGSMGFPRFQYAAVRRPTEWIVLIERRSQQDHFALLMTDLMKVLKAEDVLVAWYYYQGDPRRLATTSGDEVLLAGLAGRTRGARMLVCGSSGNLVHPVTGRMEAWASLFEVWPQRAMLLADAPRARRRQRIEEAGFALGTASVSGLDAVVKFFEDGTPRGFTPLEQPPAAEDLGEGPTVEWLAACAVYPEINWGLSLRLGQVVCGGVVSEREASLLARMEWMRDALIPPLDRERLWERIPEGRREPVQQSIGELLRSNPPPEKSFAWESWQYALRLYRPSRPPSSWQRVKDWWSGTRIEVDPSAVPDAVFLRFMDWRPQRPGALRVPPAVIRWMYEDGLRGLGLRVRAWAMVAATAAVLLGAILQPWQRGPQQRVIAGTVIGATDAVVRVGGQLVTGGRFQIPYAATIPVDTDHPIWPKAVEVRGSHLVVEVGTGRPVGRTFQPVWASIRSPIARGEETVIRLEYAGKLVSEEFRSYFFSDEPYSLRQAIPDGELFYFRPPSSRTYTPVLNGIPYPNLTLRVEVGGEKHPDLRITAVPPVVAPGGVSRLEWAVAKDTKFEVREGTRVLASKGTSVDVRPDVTTTYDLVSSNRSAAATVIVDRTAGVCAKYGLCGYDRASWRKQFLWDLGKGGWHVIVDGESGAPHQPLLYYLALFPNQDFEFIDPVSAPGTAIALASGQKEAMAKKIAAFARESGISTSAYAAAVRVGGAPASQFTAKPVTIQAGETATLEYEVAPRGSDQFRIEEQMGAEPRKLFSAELKPGKGTVSVSPAVTATYLLLRYPDPASGSKVVAERLGEVTVTVAKGAEPKAGEQRRNPVDGLIYVWIPPGTFQMGCSPGDGECFGDEKPTHQVTISKGFWMGQSEVTQAAYEKVMGINPSKFKGAQRPVEHVSWDDARSYCEKIGGRLPTEAEWEYAARAGSTAARYGSLNGIAWYSGNSGSATHDVMTTERNAYGLYDMLGNVWEWVGDWYGGYPAEAAVNPKGTATGSKRGQRGGSWSSNPLEVRVSNRIPYDVMHWEISTGFRCGGELR